ncbi:unnamed protein product, partial [Mesorhabditis spiculigera]
MARNEAQVQTEMSIAHHEMINAASQRIRKSEAQLICMDLREKNDFSFIVDKSGLPLREHQLITLLLKQWQNDAIALYIKPARRSLSPPW